MDGIQEGRRRDLGRLLSGRVDISEAAYRRGSVREHGHSVVTRHVLLVRPRRDATIAESLS